MKLQLHDTVGLLTEGADKMTHWNAALYDEKHRFVSNFGESLVTLLQPQKGEKILDVGCGTGDLANEIASFGAIVTGIDAATTMIQAAKEKYPAITFSVQDGESFSFSTQFNAIFSNAAIHWMKNQQAVIQNCYNALLPGGRFVAELGGSQNIQSIINAIHEASLKLNIPYEIELFPWVFPTKDEMTAILENAGFDIIKIDHYARPTPLIGEDGIRNWLEMFTNNMFKKLTKAEKEALYNECENILRPHLYTDHTWIADYWRIRLVAIKYKANTVSLW